MDVKYLNYVLTIAARKNMTKAAEDLYVSQSSLSQYISRLEQELGTPLFFRAKGELTLTPAGQLYAEAAKKVIDIQKQLYRNISALDMRGNITVGTTSLFGLKMLSEIIPVFRRKYPDYTIEISETGLPELKKLLLEENIDLGIMAATSLTPFEELSDILREEEIYFAVPANHPYTKVNGSGTISPHELKNGFSDEMFIRPKRGSSLRAATDIVFDTADFEPSSLCESNSVNTTRSMVAQGLGVTFLAESCANDEEHIHYYSLEPRISRLNVVTRRRNWVMNEAESFFHSLIKDYFRQYEGKSYRV